MVNTIRTCNQYRNGETSEENQAIKHLEEGFKILLRIVVSAIIQETRKQINEQADGTRQSRPGVSQSLQSDKLTYSVHEVAQLLRLSRNSVYEAVKTKQIPSIIFGRRILIPSSALKKML